MCPLSTVKPITQRVVYAIALVESITDVIGPLWPTNYPNVKCVITASKQSVRAPKQMLFVS